MHVLFATPISDIVMAATPRVSKEEKARKEAREKARKARRDKAHRKARQEAAAAAAAKAPKAKAPKTKTPKAKTPVAPSTAPQKQPQDDVRVTEVPDDYMGKQVPPGLTDRALPPTQELPVNTPSPAAQAAESPQQFLQRIRNGVNQFGKQFNEKTIRPYNEAIQLALQAIKALSSSNITPEIMDKGNQLLERFQQIHADNAKDNQLVLQLGDLASQLYNSLDPSITERDPSAPPVVSPENASPGGYTGGILPGQRFNQYASTAFLTAKIGSASQLLEQYFAPILRYDYAMLPMRG